MTYSSRFRGTKRSSAGGGERAASMRRGPWGSRIRASLSRAGVGPPFNSAGEYLPTTGESGGRGFRRMGDWTTAGGVGCADV